MKKFECPDLLWIAQNLSSYEDSLDKIYDHLQNLFEWLDNDEKNDVPIPLKIILNLFSDEIFRLKRNISNLREEFPSMPLPEWEKFNARWVSFIETIDDLKLNDR